MQRKNVSDFEKYVVNQIKKKFSFLESEYGFEIQEVVFDTTHTSVFYKNKTTAVRVSLDERMGRIHVTLIRLIDQLIPEEPVHYSQKEQINYFGIGNVLEMRAPDLRIERPYIEDLLCKPGRHDVITRVLKQNADALSMYAKDILEGNFSVLNKGKGARRRKGDTKRRIL